MASNPCSNHATDKSNNIHNTKDGLSSSFQQTVCLHDWWLIKAKNDFQGKRLAIAGSTSREWQQAVHVFSSAPIAKIYDVFTLETVDGVCLCLRGFLNKQQTTENGFPSEAYVALCCRLGEKWIRTFEEREQVLSHFSLGFPSYWEQYAAKYLVEDSLSGLKNSTPTSIHFSHSKKGESFSAKCKMKKTTTASETIGNIESEKLNSPSGAIKSIQTGNEVYLSGKSQICLMGRVLKLFSRETRSEGKCKKMPLKTEVSKMDPVAVVSSTVSNDEQSDYCELKGRGVFCLSDDEPREPVTANLTEELNDDPVKDCLRQTSIVKQGHKFTNRKTQGSVQDVLTSQSHSSNATIAVTEGETYSKEISSSRKKTKRKRNFDTHVPSTPERQVKISIVPPESLSVGRSRSGRLLLPALEFWRNQMPIYDANRKLTGIQEGLPSLVTPRGGGSKPHKTRRQ